MTDAEVLGLVRHHWEPRADAVEHLPVGWGAHHWRVDAGGEPVLFATLDPDLPRHTHASLVQSFLQLPQPVFKLRPHDCKLRLLITFAAVETQGMKHIRLQKVSLLPGLKVGPDVCSHGDRLQAAKVEAR